MSSYRREKPKSAAPAAQRKSAVKQPVLIRRKRMLREEREREIVSGAIKYFADHGFHGDTRQLAEQLGITQPLLYRYFSNKQVLIERVYKDVFLERWNPKWEEWLSDRSQPLYDRLVRFYQDYTRRIMTHDWIRLFLLSGLDNVAINRRYLKTMHERIWSLIVDEIRFECKRPTIKIESPSETEVELVWAVIASIFYIGVRRWVFGLGVPEDLDSVIEDKIKAFLYGAPAAMASPTGGYRPSHERMTGL
jgi:AcrR family transcriptional regulator